MSEIAVRNSGEKYRCILVDSRGQKLIKSFNTPYGYLTLAEYFLTLPFSAFNSFLVVGSLAKDIYGIDYALCSSGVTGTFVLELKDSGAGSVDVSPCGCAYQYGIAIYCCRECAEGAGS